MGARHLRADRQADALSRRFGISWNDASFLLNLASLSPDCADVNVDDLDEDGRGSLLWLVRRGFVELTDSMGILYARVSEAGRAAAAGVTP